MLLLTEWNGLDRVLERFLVIAGSLVVPFTVELIKVWCAFVDRLLHAHLLLGRSHLGPSDRELWLIESCIEILLRKKRFLFLHLLLHLLLLLPKLFILIYLKPLFALLLLKLLLAEFLGL